MKNKKIISIALVVCICATTFFSAPIINSVLAATEISDGDADETNEGISISKYVTVETTEDSTTGELDYNYTLDLEVFTTGVVSETSATTTPADIVLVLDQSTSMIWPASQAEDNGLDDGNIGIVDGSYTYGYDASANEDEGGYVLTWTPYDEVSVTPLYGVWSASSDDLDYLDDISVSDGNNTVRIGSGASAETYEWGESYTLDPSLWAGEYKEEYIAVFGYLYSESRQSDLIESAVEFISELDTDAGHRVSIVTYNGGPDSDGGGTLTNNGATTVYELTDAANSAKEDGSYDYTPIVDMVLDWVNAPASGNTDGIANNVNDPNNNNIDTTKTGVTTFNLEHYTQIAFGVEAAEDILSEIKYDNEATGDLADEYDGTGRTQLAVIFTDGIPTTLDEYTAYGSDSTSETNVNNALEASYNMKNDDVTVFTIGMLEDIYVEAATSNSSAYYDYVANNGNRTYLTKSETFISVFLDLLSSNYVGANEFASDDGFPSSSNLSEIDTNSTNYQVDNTYTKTIIYGTDNTGSETQEYSNYYYPIDTASDSTDVSSVLSGIFETVAGMMEGYAEIELNEETQIRDVMTAEYNIPVEFTSVTDGSGDYDLDENTDTYYYVETGGDYKLAADIKLYIAYCTGMNNINAENYSDDMYDDGYYTWSDSTLIYDTTTGSQDIIEDEVSIVVRNVYIDIARDENGDYLYGDYVYYYDSVQLNDSDDDTYYLVSNSDYIDDNGNNVASGDYIDHDGNKVEEAEAITLYPSQQVIVEGFDFNDYYVTTTDKNGDAEETGDFGAKLVIEFDIEPDTVSIGGDETSTGGATIGGNVIETNTTASGVYWYNNADQASGDMGYTALESFPVPEADIPLDVELAINNQTIYLGNSVSIVDLVTIDGHTIQGVANQYVDITYTIYAASASVEDDYSDLDDGDIIYSVTIDAGESATDATGSYNSETLITPTLDTEYIVEVTVTPAVDGTVEAETYYETFDVYVLYPDVEANDIWVDYATPVDLREDNIIQVADENGSITTFDTIRVSWDTIDSYDIEIPEPNNAIPPTVTFGFTARRGIEYTAAEFEDYGVREDKEFEITSMTTTSSDGYSNVTYYDLDEYDEAELTTFDVNINRFDLTISKTVEADVYDAYPQSFVFNVGYTGSEFVIEETYATGPNGFVIFSREDNANSVVKLYVDTEGYAEGASTMFDIYTNQPPEDSNYTKDETTGYYNITDLFVAADGTLNDNSSDNYIDLTTFTIYYGSAPTEGNDAFVASSVIETVEVKDIEKEIEAVIDPDMSTVTTTEWTDSDGTRYYTFDAVITELYCGIEMTVSEDTEWSWRYEPGFTTSTTTQYVEYYNNTNGDEADISSLLYITPDYTYIEEASDSNGNVRTTVNVYSIEGSGAEGYVTANEVSPIADSASSQVDTYIFYIKDMTNVTDEVIASLAGNFDDIDAYLAANSSITPIQASTSIMTLNDDGSITQETTKVIESYKIADFDEIHNDSDVDLGDYTGDSNEEDADTTYDSDLEGVDYDYYLTDFSFNSTSYVTTASDAKSAVILVSNSETYLDKGEGVDSNSDYTSWERNTELIYLGASLYHAEDTVFGTDTISYTNYNDDNITVYFGEDTYTNATDGILAYSAAYYYDDDGTKVNQVLDANTPKTYYQIMYTPELNADGGYVYDTDGAMVYTETEVYAFQVAEIPYAVPAVYFEPIDVSLYVFNELDQPYWLSDSELVENRYNPLDDPRT